MHVKPNAKVCQKYYSTTTVDAVPQWHKHFRPNVSLDMNESEVSPHSTKNIQFASQWIEACNLSIAVVSLCCIPGYQLSRRLSMCPRTHICICSTCGHVASVVQVIKSQRCPPCIHPWAVHLWSDRFCLHTLVIQRSLHLHHHHHHHHSNSF